MESTGLKSQSTFENLKNDSMDLAVMAAKAITQEKFARMYNPLFLHGGNRVIYSTNDSDLISSTEFVVWHAKNNLIKNYLYMIAKDYSFVKYCTQSASGTSNSHKRVNPTGMMKYAIAYNASIAELFGLKIGDSIKMYAKNQVENKNLTELRDWLLPMLMNGQVTVK